MKPVHYLISSDQGGQLSGTPGIIPAPPSSFRNIEMKAIAPSMVCSATGDKANGAMDIIVKALGVKSLGNA